MLAVVLEGQTGIGTATIVCRCNLMGTLKKNKNALPSLLEASTDLHITNYNLMELFQENSTFGKFSSVQKRRLESLAEVPMMYKAGERIWHAVSVVDRVFIIMAELLAISFLKLICNELFLCIF